MAHLRSKPRRNSQPRVPLFAKLGRALETETRMAVAWLWAPLKLGLESMLRFDLRSNINATILDRPPGDIPSIIPFPLDSGDRTNRKRASSRRVPERFLVARPGGE